MSKFSIAVSHQNWKYLYKQADVDLRVDKLNLIILQKNIFQNLYRCHIFRTHLRESKFCNLL
jgi:hypothetical protein